MKILSTKQSMCTSMKVLYDKTEDYYEDIKRKKNEGWHPVTKPSFYNENMEIVKKTSSNGVVITYIKYEPFYE